MISHQYRLVGSGTRTDGVPVCIALSYSPNLEPMVVVQDNRGPASENWEFSLPQAAGFTPKSVRYEPSEGGVRFREVIQEPSGWFERKCAEANCGWFAVLAKRIASGEPVRLEEIDAAYVAHNGKPIPCGRWDELYVGQINS